MITHPVDLLVPYMINYHDEGIRDCSYIRDNFEEITSYLDAIKSSLYYTYSGVTLYIRQTEYPQHCAEVIFIPRNKSSADILNEYLNDPHQKIPYGIWALSENDKKSLIENMAKNYIERNKL